VLPDDTSSEVQLESCCCQIHVLLLSCHHSRSQANVLRFATTMGLTAGFSLVLSILGSGLRGAMLAYV